MTHMRRHGGQAAQAKKRREAWIACTDCTKHERPKWNEFRQAEPEREEPLWAALAVWLFLLFTLWLLSWVVMGVAA